MSQLNVDDIYNRTGAYKKQQVVQVVSVQDGLVATGTNTIPPDNTIPQSSEGDEYMTLAITPKDAANILTIEVEGMFAKSAVGSHEITIALFKDSDTDALAAISQTSPSSICIETALSHEMIAGTTSEIIFKLRAGHYGGGGTLTFNGTGGSQRYGGVSSSTIIITEYQPS